MGYYCSQLEKLFSKNSERGYCLGVESFLVYCMHNFSATTLLKGFSSFLRKEGTSSGKQALLLT